MASIAVPLKSSVCSLLEAARRNLRGSQAWLGYAKSAFYLAVQQHRVEQAEGIGVDAVSRAISGPSVTERVTARTGSSLNIT